MNTQEIITINPKPTTALIADALAELGGAAAARSLSTGTVGSGVVDDESAQAVADEFHTTICIVRLAVGAVSKGRDELERLAALGLQERSEKLLALGCEHVARFVSARILAATPPHRFAFRHDTERGVVVVTFPGGMEMDWPTASHSRLLSIEPAPTNDAEAIADV